MSTLYGTATSDNQRTENFVNNFYIAALGRFATPTELQQQRDALNAEAALGVSQVQAQAESFGRSLFVSQINDASISNTQYVTNLYEGFLQRGPDAGGLGWWSGQATLGQGRQNVLNAFAVCIPFRELSATLYREVFWLVPDRLGTPRMIVSKSGTLAGVKRHDYLPFGEELTGEIGGRTPALGFTGDSVRQKFTGYEADAETGLNFAQTRYQSTVQGRFTSVDPLGASASVADPQSFNRYAYVLNNPTNLTDPDGMMAKASTSWGDVAGMFWGNSFDFATPHPSRGQYIIMAASVVHDWFKQTHSDGVLAAQYLKDGNFAAAQRIFDRNPNVGLSQAGFDFWGENASLLVENYVKAKRAYEEVASLRLPPILDEAHRLSKLLNQAALATAYALLSIARQPDFFLVDASAGIAGFGIGSSRAIVRGDGMDALTNPIVGAGIGTGGGVFAAFGWLWQLEQPTRAQIENFLSGAAGQITFFKKVGLGYIRSPNSPTKNALIAGFGLGGKAAGVSFSRRRQ